MMRRRPLAAAVGQVLPAQQQGFGLLGIIVSLTLSAAVVGVAYTVYTVTSRESDVATSTRNLADLRSAVSASYMSAATFSGLSTQSAVYAGGVPKGLLKNGLPVDVWGGAIDITPVNIAGLSGPGNDNGYALTFEEVPASGCVDFAVHGGKGFYGVNVNNASAMTGNQINTATASALCNQGATNTVQFVQAKASPNGATQPDLNPCVTPAPQSQSVACPSGQISSVAPYGPDGITQTRSGFCNMAYGVPGWTPWTTVSNICAPICTTPSPTVTPQTQSVPGSAACPPGQTGSDTWTQAQTRTQTATYACATPVGPLNTNPATYSPWVNTGGKVGEVNTCSPTCSTRLASAPWQPNPQTQTQWASASAPCPSGQIGSHTWQVQQTQSRTAACANPAAAADPVWGGWSAWAGTGATRNDVNTCAPACVAPQPSTATQSAACPSGDTGSITEQQTTTWSCPAPTGSAVASVGPWTQVGNTCAPPPPACETPTFSNLVMIIGGEPVNPLAGPGAVHTPINSLSDCVSWATSVWGGYTGTLSSPTAFCVQMFEDIDAQIAGQTLSGQTIGSSSGSGSTRNASVRSHWGVLTYDGIYVSDMEATYTSTPGAPPFPLNGTSSCP